MTVGGGASIPLITQRLSQHSRVPVVTTPQPALDAAVGAALIASMGPMRTRRPGGARGRRRQLRYRRPRFGDIRALAWSQDDDTDNEPVSYTGDDSYASDVTTVRPPIEYVPPTGPIAEEPRPWQRVPQLVFDWVRWWRSLPSAVWR